MTKSWHSYSSIYNLGHAALENLFEGEYQIEEKIDGSQFSFCLYNGELRCRSKGREFPPDGADKMFQLAVEQVKTRLHLLTEGYTYRCEYLQKPKHNVLAYDRVPKGNLVLFDVETGLCSFLPTKEKIAEAKKINIEPITVFKRDKKIKNLTVEYIKKLLETPSQLGGQKIEGIVIKNYNQFASDKKVLMGKHVSEAFKEVHKKDWKDRHPGQNDIITRIVNQYRTPARWNKAVQHLKEDGKLEDSPKDIGSLMKEVNQDVLKECEDDIKNELFEWAWKQIGRGLTRGLPEWYKEKLLEKQCGEK